MAQEYRSIVEIFESRLPRLGREDPPTRDLMQRMARAAKKGRFHKSLLDDIWDWKQEGTQFAASNRVHFDENTNSECSTMSKEVLRCGDDKERLCLLDGLQGVGVATASAILMFINPGIYGVVDEHVWKLLYEQHVVQHNPISEFPSNSEGHEDWMKCIELHRFWGRQCSRTAQDIEPTLFEYHKLLCSTQESISMDTGQAMW